MVLILSLWLVRSISAYRQVALSSDGKQFACIRVFDPTSKRMNFSGAVCYRLETSEMFTHSSV